MIANKGKEAQRDSGSINIVTASEPGAAAPNAQGQVPGSGRARMAADVGAKVLDLNRLTTFPLNVQRKKNKNDFYRFLLQQNFGGDANDPEASGLGASKVNNDILIPRSILKKHEGGRRYPSDKDEFDEFEELMGPPGPD